MKKSLFYIATAALALVSCNEQELVNAPVNQANRVLTATFEQDAATRTNIATEGNAITWSEGDQIAVYGTIGGSQGQAEYLLASGAGTASATFALNEEHTAPTDIVGAAFPYANANGITEGKLDMNLLAELGQEEVGNLDLPMWGTVTDGNIAFKHLAGVLKVNLTELPEGYNKLVVTASNQISGNFTFDTEASEPVLASTSTTNADKTVTVSFTNATATTLYLPLPVGTYESIVVSVSNGTDSKVLKQFSGITVERTKVYSTSADISTYVKTAEELATAVATESTTIVNLGADITISDILEIDKPITLNGNGFTLTSDVVSNSARVININCEDKVVIKDLTIATTATNNSQYDVRAINVIQKAANLTLDNVKASGFKRTINVAASSTGSCITINGGSYSGYSAINITGNKTAVTATDTEFYGVNDAGLGSTNDYAVIAIGDVTASGVTSEIDVTITGGKLVATSTNGNPQASVQISDAESTTVSVNAELTLVDDNVLCLNKCSGTSVKFKSEYKDELEAQGYVVSEEIDGMAKVTGIAEAKIGDVLYATLAEAIEEAEDNATIQLVANVQLSAYLPINKSITLNLGEYNITREDGTALYVNNDGGNIEVTIDGTTGKVTGTQALFVNSGLVKINGGHFHGTSTNAEAVYVINSGNVEIHGGTFSGTDTAENYYVLNEYDATRGTSEIKVYGGIFIGFNPGDNGAEGPGTNFVVNGYKSVLSTDNGWYEVVIDSSVTLY